MGRERYRTLLLDPVSDEEALRGNDRQEGTIFVDLRNVRELERGRVIAAVPESAEASVATPVAALPPYAIAKLVMGDELEAIMQAEQRNRDERRTLTIQAVCDRP